MGRHITGNHDADRLIAGYWLVQEGNANKADVDRAVADEMRSKSYEEVKAIRDAIQSSI